MIPSESWPCIISSPWVWPGLSDLLVMNRIYGVTFKIRYKKTLTFLLLALALLALMKRAACCELLYGKVHVPRNWGQHLAKSREGTKALSLTIFKELNPAHNHWVNFEVDSALVEPAALGNNLIATLWEILTQRVHVKHKIPDPQKLLRK